MAGNGNYIKRLEALEDVVLRLDEERKRQERMHCERFVLKAISFMYDKFELLYFRRGDKVARDIFEGTFAEITERIQAKRKLIVYIEPLIRTCKEWAYIKTIYSDKPGRYCREHYIQCRKQFAQTEPEMLWMFDYKCKNLINAIWCIPSEGCFYGRDLLNIIRKQDKPTLFDVVDLAILEEYRDRQNRSIKE